jgi:hypothetical protein
LLIRLAADLLVSNVAMLLGVLVTVLIWSTSWAASRGELFDSIFFNFWAPNIPVFNMACLIGFLFSGLYSVPSDSSYTNRGMAVVRAVAAALFLYLLLVVVFEIKLARSTLISGWVFIFSVLMFIRLSRVYFLRNYRFVSYRGINGETEAQRREMAVSRQQDGWAPQEKLLKSAPWPYFDQDDIITTAMVLRTGKVNRWTGRECQQFEGEFAAFCGSKYAISMANGTVALDLALYALGIGSGDEVVVTPRTFIASASCIYLCGATPVFADVDRESQNITRATIEKVITAKTRAIMVVHLAGWPCEMDPILDLASEHNLKVIEDCAQCHGAVYFSRYPGKGSVKNLTPIVRDGVTLYPRLTGSLGHMAGFSFCQDKIMSTGGEGGMLLTDDEALWEKAWAFKDHGKSYETVYRREHLPGFRWLHESFGTNWRMTEMQAAIGRRQLLKLPGWLAVRRRNAEILTEAFLKLPGLRVTAPPDNVWHAYYKYYAFVRPERLKEGWNRDRIMNAVTAEGVPCFSGSCSEVYLEKAFDGNGLRPAERLPAAKELGETSLMFLVHPTLTEKDMKTVADAVGKVMAEAIK